MDPEEAIHLLSRSKVLSHPCDLDLLLFFATHPNCLLRSETLATFLGYEPKVLAESLDTLLEGGLLTRAQTYAHAARLYALAATPDTDDWLPTVIRAASTRVGRQVLRQALAARRSALQGAVAPADPNRPGPRRLAERDVDDRQSHSG